MIRLQGRSRIITHDEVLRVVREGRVVFKDGLPIKPDDETLMTIRANVQPFGGKDLLMVPEADRMKEWFWVWTEVLPNLKIELNDRIVRDGIQYQVQSVEDWGSYTQVKMVRIDIGPNRN